MNDLRKLSVLTLSPLLLAGCLSTAVGVAGNVVEGAVSVTGDIAEGAVDQVTTSDEEKMKKDWKDYKKTQK